MDNNNNNNNDNSNNHNMQRDWVAKTFVATCKKHGLTFANKTHNTCKKQSTDVQMYNHNQKKGKNWQKRCCDVSRAAI